MIYLLEDDDSIRKLVIYALESQGMEAEGFAEPPAFWAAMGERVPDLVLLDIMLPGEDGLTILRKLRTAVPALPVIMLTARNTEYDRVEGLDAGADDYISKPFGIMELVARIRAVLRRAEPRTGPAELSIAGIRMVPDRREVTVEGQGVTLTNKEFLLLQLLMENAGLVLSREVLLDRIWGIPAELENRTLDVHIRSLRAKLGAAGACIRTVRGVGYQLCETPG
ncbi:MAG: response regulator transcription factor [Clostridia bacterium]|nr:response regulator transcription factor [Clostridia bacterium]